MTNGTRRHDRSFGSRNRSYRHRSSCDVYYYREMVLKYLKESGISRTKSGVMLGLGEKREEVLETLDDLRSVGVDIVTLGQYLQPSKKHLPVDRYVEKTEFKDYEKIGLEMGFDYVKSGSLVRSSYQADEMV
mgnify:CR=1 FL=1